MFGSKGIIRRHLDEAHAKLMEAAVRYNAVYRHFRGKDSKTLDEYFQLVVDARKSIEAVQKIAEQ